MVSENDECKIRIRNASSRQSSICVTRVDGGTFLDLTGYAHEVAGMRLPDDVAVQFSFALSAGQRTALVKFLTDANGGMVVVPPWDASPNSEFYWAARPDPAPEEPA